MSVWELITLIMFGLISGVAGVEAQIRTETYIPYIKYSYDLKSALLALAACSVIYMTIHIVGNTRFKKEKAEK